MYQVGDLAEVINMARGHHPHRRPQWTLKALAEAVTAAGCPVTEQTIKTHAIRPRGDQPPPSPRPELLKTLGTAVLPVDPAVLHVASGVTQGLCPGWLTELVREAMAAWAADRPVVFTPPGTPEPTEEVLATIHRRALEVVFEHQRRARAQEGSDVTECG